MTAKIDGIHDILERRLWDHQQNAISSVRDYLAAYGDTGDIGSALVHMPTGTGKTGVIACLGRFEPDLGSVLVLCPRLALRDQLKREIDGRFFEKLGIEPAGLPKHVMKVDRSYQQINLVQGEPTVVVMTL